MECAVFLSDFQSTQGGNLEAGTVHYPRPGLWYLLQANPDYSGLTLVGGYTNSPAFPGAACLLTPVNNPSLRTRRPQFVWSQPTPAATWFYLWLNHDGIRYKDFWINTGTDGGGGTNWLPELDLPPGNYQWWVQGWNLGGYGQWSASSSFAVP